MPHEIKHTFWCNICKRTFPSDEERLQAGNHYVHYLMRAGQRCDQFPLPWGWNFIEDKLVCDRHTITVSHNGDSITVKEGSS